jgi:hypothetical protein
MNGAASVIGTTATGTGVRALALVPVLAVTEPQPAAAIRAAVPSAASVRRTGFLADAAAWGDAVGILNSPL